jgi:hypothetical protein
MKASENQNIDLSLRVDLATAAIAYADSCVEYALEPCTDTFDAMMDSEELLFDLITEAKEAVQDLEYDFVPAGWDSVTS